MKITPYTEQLIRDCETLVENLEDWIKEDDAKMIKDIIHDIKEDIRIYEEEELENGKKN